MAQKGKIYLYNSLTRRKEELKPIRKGEVGFYSCGPTVYWYQHIGNLRAYTAWDALKRVLMYNGYNVNHVMNYTDVGHLTSDADTGDDKVELAARKEKKTAKEITDFYIKDFEEQSKLLNIIPPNHKPRATQYIAQMIEFIKKLEKKGFTYKTRDGIYFDTSKIKNYGALIGGIKAEELQAGKRVELGDKKHPTDFALWKFSEKPGVRQQEWDSEFGTGFPGWHIECSVMGSALLGDVIDIHSGGMDHRQVHHPNEMAQNEGYFDHDIVKIWLHNGFLTTPEGDKISKSKGGLKTIIELKNEGHDPLAIRYLYLSTHYRKPLIFSKETLEAAESAYYSLRNRVLEIKENSKEFEVRDGKIKLYLEAFRKAINDDLNIPQVLAIMHNTISDNKLNDAEKQHLLLDFDRVLGLSLDKVEKIVIPENIKKLADERESLRKKGEWKKADELRNKIKKEGYVIEDTEEGYRVIR